MVGRSGRLLTRSGVVTAYAFTLPAEIWPVVLVVWSHMKSTWPPTRSVSAGPVPWYGTSWSLTPAAFWNSRPHRWDAAPMPALARVTLPAFAFT